jgi:hypothetical protein
MPLPRLCCASILELVPLIIISQLISGTSNPAFAALDVFRTPALHCLKFSIACVFSLGFFLLCKVQPVLSDSASLIVAENVTIFLSDRAAIICFAISNFFG